MARQIGVKEAKAYSVATFYENFSFEAKGKYVIKVCAGTGCIATGSQKIYETLLAIAKDAPGVTLEFQPCGGGETHVGVKKTGCQGICELGPLVRIQKGDKVVQYIKGSTAQFGKSIRPKILPHTKVIKGREYCMYFPPFITARMGQKIGRRPQTQLCGAAQE